MNDTYAPSELNKEHYKLITIGILMIAIGFMDFLAFWYNLSIISPLFVSNEFNSGERTFYLLAIFVSGYLSRPLGAVLIGYYGDKYGRKPALMYSLLAVSIFTLIIGLLPTYYYTGVTATLLFIFARLAQGMVFGSQMPLIWVYISEHLPLNNTGFAGGICTAGLSVGALALLGLMYFLNNELTQSQMTAYGWRIPFILGGVLGFLLYYFARSLNESQLFVALQKTTPTPPKTSKRWKSIIGIMILSWVVASLITIMVFILEDLLLMTFFVDETLLSIAFVVCLFFWGVGCVFFGFLSDRTNTAKIFAIASILFIISTMFLFYDLQANGALMFATFAFFGFCNGIIGIIPTLMTRLCKTHNRLSTIAISYNSIFMIVGISSPALLGFFSYYSNLAPALYLSFLGVLMVFLSFYIYYIPKENIHSPS